MTTTANDDHHPDRGPGDCSLGQPAMGHSPCDASDAVAEWAPLEPLHTESVGEVVARMARLWEAMYDKARHCLTEDFPEAAQLFELCQGYDYLAAEIETGRRIPPGM
ncbi:hypothetical protein ACWDSJ_14330 [Nocardia sp. NPDC003482]